MSDRAFVEAAGPEAPAFGAHAVADWRVIAAMSILTTPSAITASLSPAVIATLVSLHHLPLSTATMLGVVELAGLTLGLTLSPLVVARPYRKSIAIAAAAVVGVGHASTLILGQLPLLILSRAFAGLGAGILFAIAISVLAVTAKPDRNIGVSATGNQVITTLILGVLAMIAGASADGLALAMLAGLAAIALVCAWLVPGTPHRDAAEGDGVRTRVNVGLAVLGLGGMALLGAGFGVTWPSIAQIGARHGIDAAEVAKLLGVVGFVGIAAGILVALLGTRLGRALPLAMGSSCMASAMILLVVPLTPFAPVMMAVFAGWVFLMPYFFGVIAHVDPSGRLPGFAGALVIGGVTAGQFAGSAIGASLGYDVLGWGGSACIAAAWAAIQLADSRACD